MLLQKAKRICKAGTTVIVNRLNGDSVGNDKYKKAELVPLEEIK